MTGLLCLQGGGEFSPGCRAMDAAVLRLAQGPVVVTALASPPGEGYRRTTEDGVRHLRAVGPLEVRGAPDAREDPEAALEALRAAKTVVLPGGSPARLLDGLRATGVAALLADLLASGGTLVGSSAGAMVLGDWTVLPDRPCSGGIAVERGLGLAPGLLVVPHWSGGSSRSDWLRAVDATVPPGTEVLGLAEESGVLLRFGELTAVGRAAARLVGRALDLPPGGTWRTP